MGTAERGGATAGRECSPSLLCDVEECCALLGVKRTFLFGLLASGRLRSVKLGRLRKIARADLEDYVERLRAEAKADAACREEESQ